MNILIVYAHPEPRSLNGSLKNFSMAVLERAGHRVQVSDLYAMQWKATADAGDFLEHEPETRLRYPAASGEAFANGTQAPEIAAEQAKLVWADVVIFQFPLWWFSMPAILKGWVDRVFAAGFAYNVGEHTPHRYGDRYGEGTLEGKRAMVIMTVGGREAHYGPRGIDGPIEDLLFPIQHGIFFYPGMTVLPPFVVYSADRLKPEGYTAIEAALEQRLVTLATTEPVAYRVQNHGDYEMPGLALKVGLEGKTQGFAMHTRDSSPCIDEPAS
ncbi:NAD(P)H-dependent oxidoreductase [Pendulispora rubella]|uniref:NAD(P)H-dependent oxidoreductase n=1 Tax=Pendulispora rubella TaxID=2741070 RepID=A0ABZ2L551_9BACT